MTSRDRANDPVHRHDLLYLQQQIPLMARRAVSVPTFRLGTVTHSSTNGQCDVIVDGDETATTMTCALGRPIPHEARVVVLFYPPNGVLATGLVTPVDLDQFWTFSPAVNSDTNNSTLYNGAWALVTPRTNGWLDQGGGELECQVTGFWDVTLHVEWPTEGSGTHRAGGLRSVGAPGNFINNSHQFLTSALQPTTGYGLASCSRAIKLFMHGDRIEFLARQDSGQQLDPDVTVALRWIGNDEG